MGRSYASCPCSSAGPPPPPGRRRSAEGPPPADRARGCLCIPAGRTRWARALAASGGLLLPGRCCHSEGTEESRRSPYSARTLPVASAAWLPVGPACPVRQDTGPVWAAEASLHNTSHPPARPATPICHSDRSPANQDRAEESRLPPPADPPTLRTTAPYAPVPSRVGQGARPARVSPAQSISSTMRHRRLPRVDLPPPLTPLGWCGRMGGTQAGQPARKGRSGPRILCVHTLHG